MTSSNQYLSLNSPSIKRSPLSLKIVTKKKKIDILLLVSQVYYGLSPKDIEDVESLALDRSRFSEDND
ncbi:MAG: hypothetical protein QY310_05785 [Candidatus Jettenia sp. CY-1]|nr:hypothetical protein [Candidatus Jettenia sp.]WKZ20072.1 MAG: hypothetical protein QY310_05785 [Candidatus Jettenia sp. CY-1]